MGWRHFMDSDISWTLFFKKGDFSWTFPKGDFSWTLLVTSRGHYFLKWATSRGHSQRVTFRGHYFSKWVTSHGQF